MIETLLILGALAIAIGFLFKTRGPTQSRKMLPPAPTSLFPTQQQPDRRGPLLTGQMPSEPQPPPTKYLCYFGGVVCWLMAAGSFAAVAQGGLVPCMFSVVLFGSGIVLFKAGYEADQKHAANMKERAVAQAAWAETERQRILTENARLAAEREAQLQHERDKAETERIEAGRLQAIQDQNEVVIRRGLTPTALDKGVDVDSLIHVNTEKHLADVRLYEEGERKKQETLRYRDEVAVDLDAGNRLQLEASDHVEELRQKLERVLSERYALEEKGYTEEHKARLVLRYEKDIAYYEGEIDAIQGRLHLSENRQTPQGLTEGAPDGGAEYPPETDEDAD